MRWAIGLMIGGIAYAAIGIGLTMLAGDPQKAVNDQQRHVVHVMRAGRWAFVGLGSLAFGVGFVGAIVVALRHLA